VSLVKAHLLALRRGGAGSASAWKNLLGRFHLTGFARVDAIT
jgi:hypothetical protein